MSISVSSGGLVLEVEEGPNDMEISDFGLTELTPAADGSDPAPLSGTVFQTLFNYLMIGNS